MNFSRRAGEFVSARCWHDKRRPEADENDVRTTSRIHPLSNEHDTPVHAGVRMLERT